MYYHVSGTMKVMEKGDTGFHEASITVGEIVDAQDEEEARYKIERDYRSPIWSNGPFFKEMSPAYVMEQAGVKPLFEL